MGLSRQFRLCNVGALFALVTMVTVMGCDDEATTAPCEPADSSGATSAPNLEPQGRVSLFVEVYDDMGPTAINAAEVGVDLRMRTSDLLGRVLFDYLPPGNKTISFFGPNHVPMRMATVLPELDDGSELRAGMRALLEPRTLVTECDAAAPCIGEFDGVKFSIPAGALRDATNVPVTDKFEVFVSRFDPEEDLHLLPGSIQTADSMKGTTIPLRVWTLASIEARKGSQPLELLEGEGEIATLEMVVPNAPSSQQAGMASLVQDDKTAVWTQTDKQGSLTTNAAGKPIWKTAITRLGLHAAMQPAEPAMTLSITVQDATGKPVTGAYVQATSKKHRSHATGFTGKGGLLEMQVPRDGEAAPGFDVRLPGFSLIPTLEWAPLANDQRPLVIKLAAPAEGEACDQVGQSRICGDASLPVTCYTEYQFCSGQVWGACSPFGQQNVEICNGIDDDCDGTIDGALTELGVPCDDKEKKGACRLGRVTSCQEGAVKCESVVEPTKETCNGIDDDCDGEVDNAVDGIGTFCAPGGQGATCMTGTTVCENGVQFCKADSGGPETCNGIDDDCDGSVDEGFGTTSCGVGACQVTFENCKDGVVAPTCDMVTLPLPSVEKCGNGIDDDCNGIADNDCCDPTMTSCPTSPEICDGIDNDRDGKTDALDDVLYENDGVTPKAYRCCTTNGGMELLGDGLDNDCDEGFDETPGCVGTTEVADGMDNNCNGLMDEPPASMCDRNTPEDCDAIDDDCDGVADDGLCCNTVWGNYYQCGDLAVIGDLPLVRDSGIETGLYGNLQIRSVNNGVNQYVGARYVLPMKKAPDQKNRWYWEVAVGPSNSANAWCVGIGTDASLMVTGDPSPNDTSCITTSDITPSNGVWNGAVISVLLDLAEGTVSYWINGTPAPTLTTKDLNRDAVYYPMTWIFSTFADVLTHNFGPDFRYQVSDLYEAPKPAP